MTSKTILEKLRAAVLLVSGFRVSDAVIDLASEPDTIQDKLVSIIPQSLETRSTYRCIESTRSWVISVALQTVYLSASSTLRDVFMDTEDALVDALIAVPEVVAISGSYSEMNHGEFLLITLLVTTQSTR